MINNKPENEPERDLPRVVVVGVGNLLQKDEGIGVHAVKALQEMAIDQDVKIIDAGTAPDLIAYTRAGDKLIIIDAAKAGGEPGTIYRLRPGDLADKKGSFISSHELGVEQNLKLMALLKNEPDEIVIFGIEPKEIGWGTELSPELRQLVPKIVDLVLKEIYREIPNA